MIHIIGTRAAIRGARSWVLGAFGATLFGSAAIRREQVLAEAYPGNDAYAPRTARLYPGLSSDY